jgi:heptosyltransferase II
VGFVVSKDSLAKEKILIIALPGIGDALLATPMIELLRNSKPDAEIHSLVMFGATREMFEHDPCIDHVHFYDFVNGDKQGALRKVNELRKMKFDVSINIYPQNRREYNAIAYMIRAKKRIAMKYLRRDRQNASWLNTHVVLEDDRYHCVEENVRLLAPLGIEPELTETSLPGLRLNLDEKHLAFARNWYSHQKLEGKKLIIGMHAGTALFKNHIRRRWAPEKYAALAKHLVSAMGAEILLFGGPDDVSANEIILREAGDEVIFVKTTNLLDSVAVMQGVNLFVSNDSSLMHIAGAVGLPTVAIFGPTNETYVHPWKTRYEIVQTGIECRPCFIYSPKPLMCYRVDPNEHFMCVRDIEVDDVYGAVLRVIGNEIPLPVLAS